MIRRADPSVLQCRCDGCDKDLMSDIYPTQANFALLRAEFGYGSPLDDDGPEYHLCEECWTKALKAVGLPKSEETS